MPRTYLTLAERQAAARKNADGRKLRKLKEKLSLIKHGVGYDRIHSDTGYSKGTICKIINTPEKATLEQLLSVCSVAGINIDFLFEQ